MDYQKAIDILNNHERYIGIKYVNTAEEAYINPCLEKAIKTAIFAMQELQKYNTKLKEVYGECDGLLKIVIDTLVEHKGLDIGAPVKAKLLTDEDVDLYDGYKQLGTLEEVREAVEKQKPKRPIIEPWAPARCPTCGEELSEYMGDGYYRHRTFLKRCMNDECAQRLDWSVENE